MAESHNYSSLKRVSVESAMGFLIVSHTGVKFSLESAIKKAEAEFNMCGRYISGVQVSQQSSDYFTACLSEIKASCGNLSNRQLLLIWVSITLRILMAVSVDELSTSFFLAVKELKNSCNRVADSIEPSFPSLTEDLSEGDYADPISFSFDLCIRPCDLPSGST